MAGIKRLSRRLVGVACLFGLLSASRAGAAPTYSYFYTAAQTAYTASAGSDLFVTLYLREVSTNNTSLINNDAGLFEGSVSVGPLTAPVAADITGNAGTPPTGFDQPPLKQVSGTTLSLSEANNINDTQGVTAAVVSTNVFRVLLGTVKVHVGSTIGQQVTYTVSPANPGFGLSGTNGPGFYDLDDNTGNEGLYNSAAATTFTVTATPEPASVGLLALVGIAAIQRRKR